MKQTIHSINNDANRPGNGLFKSICSQKYLIMMSLPFVIWVVIFAYLPLVGWLIAFKDYQPQTGILKSPFVGLQFFKEFLTDNVFYEVLRNTLVMSALNIIFNFAAAIALAIFLNEVRNQFFKRTIQTLSYLPRFVSWVVVSSIFYTILSSDGGVVNEILSRLHIIKEPVAWFTNGKLFWVIVTIADVWKNMGWNAIIYLAAIAGVDQQLYEAGEVDGLGRIGKIWHITLPGIRPTIVILLVLAIGNLLNASGFDSSFLMGNPMTLTYSDNLAVYAYRNAFVMTRFSMSAAISVANSIVSLSLLFFANKISEKFIDGKVV